MCHWVGMFHGVTFLVRNRILLLYLLYSVFDFFSFFNLMWQRNIKCGSVLLFMGWRNNVKGASRPHTVNLIKVGERKAAVHFKQITDINYQHCVLPLMGTQRYLLQYVWQRATLFYPGEVRVGLILE